MCITALSNVPEVVKGFKEDWTPITYRYPVKVELKDRYKKSPDCTNERLKEIGNFIVNREKASGMFEWKFTACLFDKENKGCEKTALCSLYSEKDGKCNQVDTIPECERCGMATSLMTFCFTDKDVGSVDPDKDFNFQQKNLKLWYDAAKEECDHIVYTHCSPKPGTDLLSCSAYLTAAVNAGLQLMFTYGNNKKTMDILNVADSKEDFKKDPKEFLATHGDEWYFCHIDFIPV